MTVPLLQLAAVAIAVMFGLAVLGIARTRRRIERLSTWRRYLAAHPSSSTAPRGTPSRRAAVGGTAPGPVPVPAPAPGRQPFLVHAATGCVCHRGPGCPRDDHVTRHRAVR